jgi:hypothetical protein
MGFSFMFGLPMIVVVALIGFAAYWFFFRKASA